MKSFPRQRHIGRHLSPFQAALGHMSANAVKPAAGGWPTASSMCLIFPLNSRASKARREDSGYHLHEHRRLTAEETQAQQVVGYELTLPFFEGNVKLGVPCLDAACIVGLA